MGHKFFFLLKKFFAPGEKKKLMKEKKVPQKGRVVWRLMWPYWKRKIENWEFRTQVLSSSLLHLCRKLSLTHAQFLMISNFFPNSESERFQWYIYWILSEGFTSHWKGWLVHLHIFQAFSALQYKNIFLYAPNFFFFILWVSYSVHSPLTLVEKMRWEQFKENHSKLYLENKNKTAIKLLRVEEINNLETFLTIWAFLMGKDEIIFNQ